MTGRNPYVIGVPLTDAAAFMGVRIFHFIRDVLDAEQQNVIVLYGQRRIGKTSVLHRAAQWLRDEGGWSPVYFDLQGKREAQPGEVLANLAETSPDVCRSTSPMPRASTRTAATSAITSSR